MNTDLSCDLLTPTIHIDKPEPCSDDAICVSLENTLGALRNLSPEAFLPYMWLTMFDDKKSLKFLAARFCDTYDMTREEYMGAYKELVDNEYLTTTTKGANILCFHDKPLVPPYLFEWSEKDEEEKLDDEVTR